MRLSNLNRWLYIPGPSLLPMDADCIDLVAWASSSTIINEDECKNNENNTIYIYTTKSRCKVSLTSFVENMYKGVEFDAVSIHCSLQVTEKLLNLLVRILFVGTI